MEKTEKGNVTVEELESSLNCVCISWSEGMHPPVIGFRCTNQSVFLYLMHTQVVELAALHLHVSMIMFKCQYFSQEPALCFLKERIYFYM